MIDVFMVSGVCIILDKFWGCLILVLVEFFLLDIESIFLIIQLGKFFVFFLIIFEIFYKTIKLRSEIRDFSFNFVC